MRVQLAVLALALPLLSGAPTLFQQPALSAQEIAFVHGGDLWIVARSGGEAKRLTSHPGIENNPAFSPDGSEIAFTAQYDGNVDVYLMPAAGGEPTRLTFHPGMDRVVGWTPDGERILFLSDRDSSTPRYTRLYTVSRHGGPAQPLDLPMGFFGSYSPDGSKLAYEPTPRAFNIWKNYRGGSASYLWIADLASGAIERIPHGTASDFNPMWAGNRIYFLSDREGATTLFAYDLGTKAVTRVVDNHGLDLKWASLGPGAIAYEQFGSIHLLDLVSGKDQAVGIRLKEDSPWIRPRFVKVDKRIEHGDISPSGARAVFEARGEILTVPAEKGDVRNLTRSSSAADRDPAWSPDGRTIAYFSDRSGEYELYLQPADGTGAARKIHLGEPASFFYLPTWSPDSRRIAYMDKRLNLWVVGLEGAPPVKVDTDTYENPGRSFDPAWSPDSRWIAYSRQLDSHLHALFAFNVETKTRHQLTDGLSDARTPVFDAEGKYLYFTASTNAGPSAAWLDMASFDRPSSRNVYLMVLRKDVPSPLGPESDEEKGAEAKKKEDEAADEAPKKPSPVSIDLEGLSQRILALPIPAKDFQDLQSARTGVLLLLEAPPMGANDGEAGSSAILHKFDLATRKVEELLSGISSFRLAAKGEKILVRKGQAWTIAALDKPKEGKLRQDAMEVWTDPRQEWRQIFHEAFRMQRDFFYDPKAHGVDLKASEAFYGPYLDALGSREDLNYLLREAMGRLSVGHLFLGGGDEPELKPVGTGLLGADFKVEQGRYRITRILDGENWNPQLKAPLTQPGLKVRAGDYLLAVDGEPLKPDEDVYAPFVGKAGRSVRLKVGPAPDGAGAREITVVPVESETRLRHRAWVEDCRRRVDKLSGGRVAYVYLPNTAEDGYTSFNRYFFAQVDKEGAVIDERFNGGGTAANYFIDVLGRKLMNYWYTREGRFFTTPEGAIFGPKAMIINEFSGSGGDALPWYFRRAGLGPLVGKRTWGGLVGIYDYPSLLDGGFLTAPRVAFFNPEGQWEVENHGVPPDAEVDLDPAAWRAGRDPQLEKAVELVMAGLKAHPLPSPHRPEFPVYTQGMER
ncbi:MAG TPA: PDZ domain-containing protein [Holophagaceae bacterium]|nr:PDZ domain-containing protein [Holophagaceae bacterium]